MIAQNLVTAFYILWLAAVLVLLAVHAYTSGRRADRIQRALVEMAERAQHNNRVAAEAAHDLAMVLIHLHQEDTHQKSEADHARSD